MKRYDKLDKEQPKPKLVSRSRIKQLVALFLVLCLIYALLSQSSSDSGRQLGPWANQLQSTLLAAQTFNNPPAEGTGELGDVQLRRAIRRVSKFLGNEIVSTPENRSEIEIDWTELSYTEEDDHPIEDSDENNFVGVLKTIEVGEREEREFFKVHKIVRAWYGPEGSKAGRWDTTNFIEIVEARLTPDRRLVVPFEKTLNELAEKDPAPGQYKKLYVQYEERNFSPKTIPEIKMDSYGKKDEIKTCRRESGDLRFLVTGDWGSNSHSKNSVAKAMKSCWVKLHGHFVISVGDHFYPNGVNSEDDIRFNIDFEDFFDKSLSPWYLVLGNHDWYADGFAQIRYSKKNPRWIMPELRYHQDYSLVGQKLPDSSKRNDKVRFIYFDTCAHMCGGGSNIRDHYSRWGKDWDEARSRDYMDNCGSCGSDLKRLGESWDHEKWLKDQLDLAQVDPLVKWVIVVGHHAITTGGGHQSPLEWGRKLVELAQRYTKWLVYFSGHNHGFEYLTLDRGYGKNPLHHFATGTGGNSYALSKFSLQKAGPASLGFLTEYQLSCFGYTAFSISNTRLTFELINSQNEVLYTKDVSLLPVRSREEGPEYKIAVEKSEIFPKILPYRRDAINGYFTDSQQCATDPSSILRWLAVGNWGAANNKERANRERIASSMVKCHSSLDANFVMSTGDQFFNGLKTVDSKKFHLGFTKTFKELTIPWHPVMGDMDWSGQPELLLSLAKSFPSKWKMGTSRQYLIKYPLADGPEGKNASVWVVAIDTCAQMCGSSKASAFHPKDLAALCAQCPEDVRLGSIDKARQWFEAKLTAAEADIEVAALLVVGHHPIVTGSTKFSGHDWKAWMVRLVDRHPKWLMYFASHVNALEYHTLERRTVIHNGGDNFVLKENERVQIFHHIVSGGGGHGEIDGLEELRFGGHGGESWWQQLNTNWGSRGKIPRSSWHFGFRSMFEGSKGELGFFAVRLGWDFMRIEIINKDGEALFNRTEFLCLACSIV